MEPIGLTALLAAGITPTFTFLYGQLVALLDRRADKRNPHRIEVDSAGAALLDGSLTPTESNADLVEKHWPDLIKLAGALSVYHRHLERLNIEDGQLRAQLGELRGILELIYGQRITFRGENRQGSGTTLRQRVDRLSGTAVAYRGDPRGASLDLTQDVENVERGGWMIGIQDDRI